jgi:hypothetical protein
MTTAEALVAARQRIAEPEHWATRFYARDERGKNTNPQGTEAVSWCAMGALRAGEWTAPHCFNAEDFLQRAAQEITGYSTMTVPTFNDTYTHADVLAMYDLAIKHAEATEGTR